MKQFRNKRILIISLFLMLTVLSACNMPRRVTPAQSGLEPITTFAAQTIEAQLTAISKPPSTALVTTPLSTPESTANPLLTPQLGTITPSPNCNIARFVKDISIADNTELPAGITFTKTWELENAGNCKWTTDYKLFFYQGDKMGAPDVVPFPKEVAPGESIEISVKMTTPDSPGSYKGEWKLRSASGEVFGTGKNGNPVWVQVLVVTKEGLDFISEAKSAYWRSGAPGDQITELTLSGDINDPAGAAKIVEGQKMENGRISGKVLLTIPRHVKKGWTSGRYPPYYIQRGNHLEARIGFLMNENGACGSGKVLFQIKYMEGEEITTLGEWQKSCDGILLPIDIDLSRLAGKTVQFILSAKALNASQDNWAIWNSPQITK